MRIWKQLRSVKVPPSMRQGGRASGLSHSTETNETRDSLHSRVGLAHLTLLSDMFTATFTAALNHIFFCWAEVVAVNVQGATGSGTGERAVSRASESSG